MIAANAPYVPSAEISRMPLEAREYEPHHALDGGADGLDVVRRIAASAGQWLAPGGWLLVETSPAQSVLAVADFARCGLAARVLHDAQIWDGGPRPVHGGDRRRRGLDVTRMSMFEFAGGESASGPWPRPITSDAWPIRYSTIRSPSGTASRPRRAVDCLLGEVLGGPPTSSRECDGEHPYVLSLHSQMRPSRMGERFVTCFVAAIDDAKLPADAEFRTAMRAYMQWAVAEVMSYAPRSSSCRRGARCRAGPGTACSPVTQPGSARQRSAEHPPREVVQPDGQGQHGETGNHGIHDVQVHVRGLRQRGPHPSFT